MHAGTLTEALRAGDAPVGVWSTIPSPVVAELLAADGFDFVVLDGEHSEHTIETLADGVRAVEAATGDADPVVRASGDDPAEIRRVLDLGPAGVVIPQIEDAEAAREAVSATRYPPAGLRGVAGGRASEYGEEIDEYVETADDRVATILQIETPGAVEDAAAIAALDGVDALFVGPADLSARLGAFGEFDSEGFREAVARVTAAAADAGVPVGTLATTPEQVETRRDDWGMDFVVAGTDVGCLRSGASDFLAASE
ncbi:HpcH/HpaI aldolase family protein [Halobacterium litoreum]|uniref:HpcH/HpaI aldolase/citrate lyase family protein n=1 Tax=Halobacterium litoreum TaxID=2039234 RepID=A0ABD5NGI5_9EURY|nr:aldolase/citrate lyase family protein [Halobacterium litoreum]UHH12868.1 aldolase/citrate lyase family protein [Halobacterium litoreum]